MHTVKPVIWTPTQPDLQKERTWITKEIREIGLPKLEELAKQASEARKKSYSPYSSYKVGAAVLTNEGKTTTGQNIEIATYSETGHAEEQAIKNAVSNGAVKNEGKSFIRAVATTSTPCGRCRQIIEEFGDNPLIIILDTEGTIRTITSLKVLLPYAFSQAELSIRS